MEGSDVKFKIQQSRLSLSTLNPSYMTETEMRSSLQTKEEEEDEKDEEEDNPICFFSRV